MVTGTIVTVGTTAAIPTIIAAGTIKAGIIAATIITGHTVITDHTGTIRLLTTAPFTTIQLPCSYLGSDSTDVSVVEIGRFENRGI